MVGKNGKLNETIEVSALWSIAVGAHFELRDNRKCFILIATGSPVSWAYRLLRFVICIRNSFLNGLSKEDRCRFGKSFFQNIPIEKLKIFNEKVGSEFPSNTLALGDGVRLRQNKTVLLR